MKNSKPVVLITGCSTGIGRALAEEFNRQSFTVYATARKIETLSELKKDRIHTLSLDVNDEKNIDKVVSQIIKEQGKIDILINNAGITRDQLMLRMSEDDFDKVLDVNLKGTWNMIKSVVPFMTKARYGKIINLASVSGLIGNAGQANYSASKAGIIGLSKSVAREFSKRNITCNAVAPGYIETKMTESLPDSVKEHYLKEIPLGRYGQVEDVASLVLFLASKHADYITGQVVHVDGGMVMS